MWNPAPHTRMKASKPDLRPKHRRSGSVSSAFIASEDFSGRDTNIPVSAVSSSIASVKDRRAKRRTRSSLGGAEDFIKDLDFLALPGKQTSGNGAHKDRSKPSSNLQVTESAPKSATEVFAAVSEASAPANVVEVVEGHPIEPTNNCGRESGAGLALGNAAGPDTKKLVRSSENGICPDEAGVHIDSERPRSADICPDEVNEVVKAVEKTESRRGSPLISGNGDSPQLITKSTAAEVRCVLELPVQCDASTSLNVVHQKVEESNAIEVDPSSMICFRAVRNCQVAPTKQQLQERLVEEKVSVQKRIEELERKATARRVHFRSQSLSLPRAFDVSHSQHHEAEGSRGFKMPPYHAPPDVEGILQIDCSELLTAFQDNRFPKNSTGKAAPARQTEQSPCHGSAARERELREVTQNEEGQASIGPEETPGSPAAVPELQNACVAPDVLKAKHGPPGGVLSASHLEDMVIVENTAMTFTGQKIASAGTAESQLPDDSNMTAEATEQDLVDTQAKCRPSPASPRKTRSGSEDPVSNPANVGAQEPPVLPKSSESNAIRESGALLESAVEGVVIGSPETGPSLERKIFIEGAKLVALPDVSDGEANAIDPSGPELDETSVLLTKQPAVDPLFIDSQQDRLWEMHSQELTLGEEGESSCPEVRESSAHDEDASQYANGTPTHRECAPSSSTPNGTSQSDKSGKMDRPRTPLRSLLAEEEAAESGTGSETAGPRSPSTTPQNQLVSPRGNLFRRIVSGGRNSPPPTKPPSSKFSPKPQTVARPFFSSCICCSPVK